MGSPYRIINRGDTWSVLYVRKHRLIGLEDSLEIYSPSGHLPGGTGNHAGYSGGIVTISERLKGTMSFSVIVVYRSTAMSLLVVWDWNESNWDTDWEH